LSDIRLRNNGEVRSSNRGFFSKKKREKHSKEPFSYVEKVENVAFTSIGGNLDKPMESLKAKQVEVKKSTSSYVPLFIQMGALIVITGVIFYFRQNRKSETASDLDSRPLKQQRDPEIPINISPKHQEQPLKSTVNSQHVEEKVVQPKLTEDECMRLFCGLGEDFASDTKDIDALVAETDKIVECQDLIPDTEEIVCE
jgi:hypothetical protein